MLTLNQIKEREKRKILPSQRIIFSIFLIVFILYAMSLLYPLLWMMINSFKGRLEYQTSDPFALPGKWLIANYGDAFKMLKLNNTTFLGMAWNSVWMSGLSIFIGMFFSAITSYVLAKLDFPGRKLIYAILLLQMMIPIYGSLASSYRLVKTIGIFNTPFHVMTSSLAIGGYKFLILYAFFKGISWNYAEAGYIDGASHAQVFFKIMLPQAIAPIMTFAMTDFVGAWNDYMSPLIWMPGYPTLASGLYEYEQNMIRAVNYPVYFAGVVISVIPILIIFISFQDTFMTSLSMGGLKG